MKNGIVAIHKPEGISSARVVAQVKKALGVKKVGHTGTLDPFATGLLLCGINQGTRISRFFLEGHKRYITRIRLGVETDTYDLTGKPVFTAPLEAMQALREKDVEAVIKSFVGLQDQVAPAYSALKHEGQPLYKLARQGKIIQKPARRIEIFDIRILEIALPNVDIEVFCSAGTYIRSLGFDIGRQLGCGAHLSQLCRTQSSSFLLETAISLDAFKALDKTAAEERILPLSGCLEFMPKMMADPVVAQKVRFGQKLYREDFGCQSENQEPFIRVTDNNNVLLAIVEPGVGDEEYNYSCVFTT